MESTLNSLTGLTCCPTRLVHGIFLETTWVSIYFVFLDRCTRRGLSVPLSRLQLSRAPAVALLAERSYHAQFSSVFAVMNRQSFRTGSVEMLTSLMGMVIECKVGRRYARTHRPLPVDTCRDMDRVQCLCSKCAEKNHRATAYFK